MKHNPPDPTSLLRAVSLLFRGKFAEPPLQETPLRLLPGKGEGALIRSPGRRDLSQAPTKVGSSSVGEVVVGEFTVGEQRVDQR